jgi:hypothetical protein
MIAAVFTSAVATRANGQFGGRQRGQGGGPTHPSYSGDANSRAAAPALADPIITIERELPSLRVDL